MLQRPRWCCKFNRSGELGTLKASRHQSEAYSPTGGVTRNDNRMDAHFTGLNSSHIGETEINLVLWLHLLKRSQLKRSVEPERRVKIFRSYQHAALPHNDFRKQLQHRCQFFLLSFFYELVLHAVGSRSRFPTGGGLAEPPDSSASCSGATSCRLGSAALAMKCQHCFKCQGGGDFYPPTVCNSP